MNERLAKRSGIIGRFFKGLEMGERQYSGHRVQKVFKINNFIWVKSLMMLNYTRPIFTRFFGVTISPLNYSGLLMWCLATGFILSRLKFTRFRDFMVFNKQDQPEFWFRRYAIIFPPQLMNNRISAHFVEINHIYFVEMFKKFIVVKDEIVKERLTHDDLTKRTKYALNPNYVYEPLKADHPDLQRIIAE